MNVPLFDHAQRGQTSVCVSLWLCISFFRFDVTSLHSMPEELNGSRRVSPFKLHRFLAFLFCYEALSTNNCAKLGCLFRRNINTCMLDFVELSL
jgi:hypothetical protein